MHAKVVGGPCYVGKDVLSGDMMVGSSSLLKRRKMIDDFSVINISDTAVKVIGDGIAQRFSISKIPLKTIDIHYDSDVYTYTRLQKSHIIMRLEYEDGFEEYVQDFDVDTSQIITRKMSVPITVGTMKKSYDLEIDPIPLDYIDAQYTVPIYKGDKFDLSNVTVELVYEDGYRFKIDNVSTDFSGEINRNRSIKLDLGTIYGVCTLDLKLEQPDDCTIEYGRVIYEGTPINPGFFSVYVQYPAEDHRRQVTDLTVTPAVVTEPTTLALHSDEHGDFEYDVTPVPIESMEGVYTMTDAGLELADVRVTYDGSHIETWHASDENFELLTDVSTVKPGDPIKFRYWDIDYSIVYDDGTLGNETAVDEEETVETEPATDAPVEEEPQEQVSAQERYDRTQQETAGASDEDVSSVSQQTVADDGGIVIEPMF